MNITKTKLEVLWRQVVEAASEHLVLSMDDGIHADSLSVGEIREYLNVDSLAYLELERVKIATGAHGAGFCDACFTGRYPIGNTGGSNVSARSSRRGRASRYRCRPEASTCGSMPAMAGSSPNVWPAREEPW